MENISNSELLYDVIDTLNDEEFKDLLDTLSIEDKAEEVIEEKTEAEEAPVAESVEDDRKLALQKRVAEAKAKKAKREAIAEKLEAARKKKTEADAKDELHAKIMEKLKVARRKHQIQERVKQIRNESK